jgi:hypothetical protein
LYDALGSGDAVRSFIVDADARVRRKAVIVDGRRLRPALGKINRADLVEVGGGHARL